MRLLFSFSFLLFLFELNVHAQYYVVSSQDDSLYVLANPDIVDFFYADSQLIEINDNPIGGFNGLTQNPLTGNVYTVYFSQQGGTRFLATIDLIEHTVSTIEQLSDKIASICFDDNGNLYGISGDGGPTPNTLYQIDPASAELQYLVDLSTLLDDDGEAIEYNSSDGFIYRMAGGSYLYKIDLATLESTLVTDNLSDGGTCGHALYYDSDDDSFIALATFICVMTSDGLQDCIDDPIYEIPDCVKGVLPMNIMSINEEANEENLDKRLIMVLDALGREANHTTNQILFHIYDDGSIEKKFIVE